MLESSAFIGGSVAPQSIKKKPVMCVGGLDGKGGTLSKGGTNLQERTQKGIFDELGKEASPYP